MMYRASCATTNRSWFDKLTMSGESKRSMLM